MLAPGCPAHSAIQRNTPTCSSHGLFKGKARDTSSVELKGRAEGLHESVGEMHAPAFLFLFFFKQI